MRDCISSHGYPITSILVHVCARLSERDGSDFHVHDESASVCTALISRVTKAAFARANGYEALEERFEEAAFDVLDVDRASVA